MFWLCSFNLAWQFDRSNFNSAIWFIWPTSNKKHFILTFLRFHYRRYSMLDGLRDVDALLTTSPPVILLTFSSVQPGRSLQISLLLLLLLLHLRRQLSRGHSDEGLSPETTPHCQFVAQWMFTLLTRDGSPDVQLLAAAGFSNSGQFEAPLLPHGGRHLRIQPPHKDTTTHKTKTTNSPWV